MTTETSDVRFLNVDLEVRARDDLQWLLDEFGEDVVNLHHGQVQGYFVATFESGVVHGDPDSLIGYFCTLIRNLPAEARQKWDGLFSKVFDLGYDSGLGPKSWQSDLRAETVEEISRAGASLRITIYPAFRPRTTRGTG